MEKKKRLEVVWVPRDYIVQDLLQQYVDREIDYIALTTAFKRKGWSTAGLFEVIQQMESKKELERKIGELRDYKL